MNNQQNTHIIAHSMPDDPKQKNQEIENEYTIEVFIWQVLSPEPKRIVFYILGYYVIV